MARPCCFIAADRAKAYLAAFPRVGHRRFAELTGLSWLTIWRIRTGRIVNITPATERAILSVRPSLAHGCYVSYQDSYNAKRLLLGVLAEEYAVDDVAVMVGMPPQALQRFSTEATRTRLRVRTVLKLRQLWDMVNDQGIETK